MQKSGVNYYEQKILERKISEKKKKLNSWIQLSLVLILTLCICTLVLKCIDWIYLAGSKSTNTTLSSGDVLGYAGVILGGVFLLIGVVWTIRSESSLSRKERVLSVKPYLVSYKVDLDLPEKNDDNSLVKPDYNIINIRYIVSTGEFNFSYHTPSIYDLRGDRISEIIFIQNTYRRFMTFKYIVENIGCGSAVDGILYFNENVIDKNFAIAINGKREFNFIIDFGEYDWGVDNRPIDAQLENIGFPISFQLRFFDSISFTKYRQKETFTVRRDCEKYLEIRDWSGLYAPEKVDENDD